MGLPMMPGIEREPAPTNRPEQIASELVEINQQMFELESRRKELLEEYTELANGGLVL